MQTPHPGPRASVEWPVHTHGMASTDRGVDLVEVGSAVDARCMDRDPQPLPPQRRPRGFLTLDEAAELLGLPQAEVYRKVRRGDWPGSLRLQTEPRWLVPRDALET